MTRRLAVPLSAAIAAVFLASGASARDDASSSDLRQGSTVEGKLAAGEARTFPLAASPGDYIRGKIDGGPTSVTLLRDDGGHERRLVAAKAPRQDFQLVIGESGPYRLEVRAAAEGPFTLTIESVVPASAQAAPAKVLESPRLRALEKAIASGEASTEAFWKEVRERDKGPLVEREGVVPPVAKGSCLVTFLYRGAKHAVKLFAAPSNDHEDMFRLGNSDVWYRSYRVPEGSRFAYRLAPDIPELNAPPWPRRRAILATARRDPLNPRSFPERDLPDEYAGDSVLELPGAKQQPWLERRSDVPAGTVERQSFTSNILGNTREVFLYRPHGYTPGAEGNSLLVLFDGERYVEDVEVPRVLDTMIAARAIPPTAAVLIGNGPSDGRSVELPPNPKFARFLAEELMPSAGRQGLVAPASRTVLCGASYGGLAAVYHGWTHPELFGNVISQSGSFWWNPGAAPGIATGLGMSAGATEPEWLSRQIADAPARPVNVYLEAGLFESGHGTTGIIDATRHLRDVLKARGYKVQMAEPAGAHGFFYWRYTLPDALLAVLGKPAS